MGEHSGGVIPYGDFKPEFCPRKAFKEALETTSGLHDCARTKIKISPTAVTADDVVEQAPPDQTDMTLSPEYSALIRYYSNDRGKIDYQLLNRDFTKFAARSKVVAGLAAAGTSQEEILAFVVKSRITRLARLKESPDDKSILLLIETREEIDPHSAFKGLKACINRLLTEQKETEEMFLAASDSDIRVLEPKTLVPKEAE